MRSENRGRSTESKRNETGGEATNYKTGRGMKKRPEKR